ncbi:MAG: histidine--tRNA ligase [Anaerolineae bacterium]
MTQELNEEPSMEQKRRIDAPAGRGRRIERLRGMDDVLPSAARYQREIIGRLSQVAESHGFALVDVPVFEYTELFLRKSGEALAPKLYAFTFYNRGICARPEFTASVGRLYVESLQDEPLPQRLYYHGPVFRYEKPQRGRRRQFTQFGLEIIGGESPLADAELILIACEGLEAVGITNYCIVLGHIGAMLDMLKRLKLDRRARNFVLGNLENLGRPDRGLPYVEDRLRELYPPVHGAGRPQLVSGARREEAREVLGALLSRLNAESALGSRTVEEVVEGVLDQLSRPDQVPLIRQALALAEQLHRMAGPPGEALPAATTLLEQHHLSHEPLRNLADIVELLRAAGLPEEKIIVNLGMGRGLYYYTGMIFEVYPSLPQGDEQQLCGGGRYDDLIVSLGGRQRTPACGLAYGVQRLASYGREEWQGEAPQALIGMTSPALHGTALALVRRLRREGVRVELDLRNRSQRANLNYAEKRGIAHLILVDGTPASPQYHMVDVGSPKQPVSLVDIQEMVQVLQGTSPATDDME